MNTPEVQEAFYLKKTFVRMLFFGNVVAQAAAGAGDGAAAMQTEAARRLIETPRTPVTPSRSRLGTSACLMKCQSLRSEGWRSGGGEGGIGERRRVFEGAGGGAGGRWGPEEKEERRRGGRAG